MADLAVVFHWGDDRMDDMEPAELLRWHERARDRLPLLGGRHG